jgi:hypothetical protein
MRRKLLFTAISLMAFSGGLTFARAQDEAIANPVGCANTICGGVTYCTYSAGYSCSLTASSCTNTFCAAVAQEPAAPRPK